MNIYNLSVLNSLGFVAMQASIECDERMRGCACERFAKDGLIELQAIVFPQSAEGKFVKRTPAAHVHRLAKLQPVLKLMTS